MPAQDFEIQARIVDSSDFNPVSFATVYLIEEEGTISDDQGFFRLQLSSPDLNDSIYISCIGYSSVSVAISDLDLYSLDTIYMDPYFVELKEVLVETKKRKPPKAKKILQKAIDSIFSNYPADPVKYRGYYREYVKQQDRYLNLLESIIELEDPGIFNPDDFESGLLFKRNRPEYEINDQLIVPYDNVYKFIPYSTAPTKTGNELVLLRFHDPVRNYNKKTFYFKERLDTDFIRAHRYESPKLTYLDNRPYYRIDFTHKRENRYFNTRVFATGTAFVDGYNYGIKRLSYRGMAERPGRSRKLFELSLEYKWTDDVYHLNYISFNNLFTTRNFCLLWYQYDTDMGAVQLKFNRMVDPVQVQDTENFSVTWKGREMIIKEISVEKEINRVNLVLLEGSMITEQILYWSLGKGNIESRLNQQNTKYLYDNMEVEVTGLKDYVGNIITDCGTETYYQYRELFMRNFDTANTAITKNLIDRRLPVFDSQVFGEIDEDTTWLNSPLISEMTDVRKRLENPEFSDGLRKMSEWKNKTRNDLVYLHTDCEVYAPEDTLWFKGYVRDRSTLHRSGRSQTLHVLLVDAAGNIRKEGRFYIENGDVHGQLRLDPELREGSYYLMGYSSWMKNYSPEGIFRKHILIRRDLGEVFNLVASYDRGNYFPGDTVKISINCYDEKRNVVEDVKFSYSLESGDEQFITARGNTSITGKEPLVFVVPEGMKEVPDIRLKAVYKGSVLDTLYRIPVNHEVLIDFFPEGGHMIQGIKSQLAFKSRSGNGNPVEVEADIVDEEGKVIRQVQTEHDGMGVFDYTPAGGKERYLRIIKPRGYDKLFPLPEGKESGWTLSVRSSGEYFEFSIRRKNTGSNEALLVIKMRNEVQYYRELIVRNRETINIPATVLSEGIAVATLYDSRMLPQAERLLVVSPPEQRTVVMKTDRLHYIPRDSVNLALDFSSFSPWNPNGSYSLSVIDEQLCTEDIIAEPDIRYSFLFGPEIKGRIHNPGYYLNAGNRTVQHHIDMLMMTQGWRDYEYITDNGFIERYPEPVNGDIISGWIARQQINRNDEHTKGSIQVYYRAESSEFQTDESGRFSILPEYYPGERNSIFFSAENEKGRKNVLINLDSSHLEKKLVGFLNSGAAELKNIYISPVATPESFEDGDALKIANHKWIEEVRILGKRKEKPVHPESFYYGTRSPADLDIKTSNSVFEILLSMGLPVQEEPDGTVTYHGPPWEDAGNAQQVPSVVVWMENDLQIEYRNIRYVDTRDIESLYVVYYPETQNLALMNIYDPELKPPKVIVSLHTTHRSRQVVELAKNSLVTPRFTISKKYYKPLYDTEAKRASQIPDIRKTIHWEPDLKINEEGRAKIQFYNADRFTRIKCILEGITDNGIPVYTECFYNVSLDHE